MTIMSIEVARTMPGSLSRREPRRLSEGETVPSANGQKKLDDSPVSPFCVGSKSGQHCKPECRLRLKPVDPTPGQGGRSLDPGDPVTFLHQHDLRGEELDFVVLEVGVRGDDDRVADLDLAAGHMFPA